jgi:hypothetical protein
MPVLKVYEPNEGTEKLWHFRLLLLKTASLFLVAIPFCAGGLYRFDESGAPQNYGTSPVSCASPDQARGLYLDISPWQACLFSLTKGS